MYFKKLLQPEYFQGNKKKNKYFEGWYYKLVNDEQDYTIALIPGISINKKDPHAFIQVFVSYQGANQVNLKSFYTRFPLEDFSFSHEHFWVRIGRNYFSKDKIDIQLKTDQINLFGVINIKETTPIKKSILSPNIMGTFGYLNFMECYHGVISMSHLLDGKFKYNNQIISFNQAKGYMEKDWGKSFPRAYVWIQSNHFSLNKTSLMFSYADIPFLGFYFKGLISILNFNGKEYRFATYNHAKVKHEEIKEGYVRYTLKKRKYILEIEAYSKTEIGLASPRNGEMIETIKEGLSGQVKISLYEKKKLIYEDIGQHAGIEIMKR
jgi:tocopherol cyclase